MHTKCNYKKIWVPDRAWPNHPLNTSHASPVAYIHPSTQYTSCILGANHWSLEILLGVKTVSHGAPKGLLAFRFWLDLNRYFRLTGVGWEWADEKGSRRYWAKGRAWTLANENGKIQFSCRANQCCWLQSSFADFAHCKIKNTQGNFWIVKALVSSNHSAVTNSSHCMDLLLFLSFSIMLKISASFI